MTDTGLTYNPNTGILTAGNLAINNTLNLLTATITSQTVGTSTLYSLLTSKGNSMFVDYTIYNTSKTALRSGTVICNFTTTNITYSEHSTSDLGNSTSAVQLISIISGSNAVLQSIITGTDT